MQSQAMEQTTEQTTDNQQHDNNIFLLKLGDADLQNEQFTSICGIIGSNIKLNRSIVKSNNLESGKWREIASGGGLTSLTITGEGIIIEYDSEDNLMRASLSGLVRNYQLYFMNGDILSAGFVISSYSKQIKTGEVETFTITMESSGEISLSRNAT